MFQTNFRDQADGNSSFLQDFKITLAKSGNII